MVDATDSDTDARPSGSPLSRLRAVLTAEPDSYWRLWLTGINLVGLVVVAGALFDIGAVVGRGQTGIYRRSLYPFVPPALTLGAALFGRSRRRLALSGGLLLGYAALLTAVGVLPEALRVAPRYSLAGLLACVALTAVGWAFARRVAAPAPTAVDEA